MEDSLISDLQLVETSNGSQGCIFSMRPIGIEFCQIPKPSLRKNLLDDFRMLDTGQPLIQSLKRHGEPLVIEAKQM